jgi:protein gp37
MSDLFHKRVPDDYIVSVVKVMELANWHTYQVLTKRAQRLHELLTHRLKFASKLNHIWWGVSVENRQYGLPRIELLRNTPVPTRFLSVEPLLEDMGSLNLDEIHWVIVGGESGPKARPMKEEWVNSIRQQCKQARIPFFFKQWGGFPKSKNGRKLNGQTYDALPRIGIRSVPSNEMRQRLLETAIQLNLATSNIDTWEQRASI